MNFVNIKDFINKDIIIIPDKEHNKYKKVKRLFLEDKEFDVSNETIDVETSFILKKFKVLNSYITDKYIFNFVLSNNRDIIYTSYLDRILIDKINTYILITDLLPNEYDIHLNLKTLTYNYNDRYGSTITNLSNTDIKLAEPINIKSNIYDHIKCVSTSKRMQKYVSKTLKNGDIMNIPTLLVSFRNSKINDILD